MDRLRNAVRRDIEAIVSTLAQPRFATVASVDPDTHSVRVALQPEGTLSGWIPDASAFATGGGFGVVAPLTVGDQVLVVHPHADADYPVVVGRLFSAVDAPPVSPATGKSVQPGEFAVFTSGAWLHISGGVIHAQAAQFLFKGDMTLDGNLTVTGDMNVLGTKSGATGSLTAHGEIADLAGARGTLDTLRTDYDGHRHGGVQRGGATTDATDTPTP